MKTMSALLACITLCTILIGCKTAKLDLKYSNGLIPCLEKMEHRRIYIGMSKNELVRTCKDELWFRKNGQEAIQMLFHAPPKDAQIKVTWYAVYQFDGDDKLKYYYVTNIELK